MITTASSNNIDMFNNNNNRSHHHHDQDHPALEPNQEEQQQQHQQQIIAQQQQQIVAQQQQQIIVAQQQQQIVIDNNENNDNNSIMYGELLQRRSGYNLDNVPLIALSLFEVKPEYLESLKPTLNDLLELTVTECGHPFSLCLERVLLENENNNNNNNNNNNDGNNSSTSVGMGPGDNLSRNEDGNEDNVSTNTNNSNVKQNEPANILAFSEHVNQLHFETVLQLKCIVNFVQELMLSQRLKSIFRLSMWYRVNAVYCNVTTIPTPPTCNNNTDSDSTLDDTNPITITPPQTLATFYMMRTHHLKQMAPREAILKILCRLAQRSVHGRPSTTTTATTNDSKASSSPSHDSSSNVPNELNVQPANETERTNINKEGTMTNNKATSQQASNVTNTTTNNYTCLSHEVLISNDIDRYNEILEIISYPSKDDYIQHQTVDMQAQEVSKMTRLFCETEPQITLWQRPSTTL